MKKRKIINTFNAIKCFFTFLYCFLTIKAQTETDTDIGTESPPKYEIHIKFGKTGLQNLYCDDNILLFDTENINFYKIDVNGVKTDINLLLIKGPKENYCAGPIKYNVNNIEEKIIIEIINSPSTLKQLFAGSQISKIERFDYPFPVENTDFNGMFYNCVYLTLADLSNFSFVNTRDVSNMFYNCTNLEIIIFPANEKSISIQKFSDMFAFCKKLKTIDLSSLSFINARDLSYMFNACTNLETIIFPENEIAENVETFYETFINCENLKSLDLSIFNFKNARNMAYMFSGCTNLMSINFSITEKSTSLQNCKNMFSGCSQLTSIDLSLLSFVNIDDISSFCNGCLNLETLILPQNETASNIRDFSYMLSDCSKLGSVDFSNIDFVKAKKLSYMFYGCKKLENLILPTSAKATEVESYQNMFLNCENLKSIDLSNFSFMKAKDLNGMFFDCISLETVILPKNEFATDIEDISYMFAICSSLKSIDLSCISFKNVKTMSYLFFNCAKLETIIYPDDDEYSNIESISFIFANCHELKTINLTKFNLEKVTDLSYLFYSCNALEQIIFPSKKMNNIIKLEHTFEKCTKLQSIDFTNIISTISLENLDYAFANCKNLKFIKFPENEEIKNIVTMNSTFANCTSLTSLDLSQIYIDDKVNLNQCFLNCPLLKDINIFNIDTTKTNLTYNFLYGDSFERCLYYSYDNANLGEYTTNKICSKYIGYHKCGPCSNNNENEYCTINKDGQNLDFYYLESQLNLPISERECYWSKNDKHILRYMFMNNTNQSTLSYYIDYCENYCDICSENKYGCLKCKSEFYPIDTEYNDYINNIKTYYFCYSSNDMQNYYLNKEKGIFIKCSEKCLGCKNGVDICSNCNNEKEFYNVEGEENECWLNQPKNYWTLDKDFKIWRKCNDRCKQCIPKSINKCTECAENYYPYYKDYLNFNNNLSDFFYCYTLEEVKMENENYFLNGNCFDKCDESCAQCEIKADNCLKCQMNYFMINGENNRTCFQAPLENFIVSQNERGESVFLHCFYLCKFCHKMSESFLYQQCSQCDEEEYTLDIYSLNKSYCVPKIKHNNNTYSVQDEEKWIIEDFEGIENFNIINKLLEIDYQRLLNREIFKNLTFKIVNECPKDKPYIIYTTRQCVSSCFSTNLIEFGIFMTEQLYLYNNICYNVCPFGSIKDNKTFTCKEKNEYTTNISLTKDLYDKSQEEYRKRYLGDEYAKKTVQSIRAFDFSTYHHIVNINDINDMGNINKLKEQNIPIFIFPECLTKLRNKYNLNESENIYIEIIENNDKNEIFNDTSFKFFNEKGVILDSSICANLDMYVIKKINISMLDDISFLEILEKMRNKSYNISDPDTFLDRCEPISIDDKDWPVADRERLINKSKNLCDPGCTFISFDKYNNYSFCQCKILEQTTKTIRKEIKNDIKNLEFIERLEQLLEDGNWYYLFCYKKINRDIFLNNWIMYFGFVLIIIEIALFFEYFRSNYNKVIKEYINRLRYLKFDNNLKNINGNVTYNSTDDINENENENDKKKLTTDYNEAKMHNISFWKTFSIFLKEKLIVCICSTNKDHINPKILKSIKLIIFLQNYYFLCGFLFTERYISSRIYKKSFDFEYAFVTEKQRICLIIIICSTMNLIIFFFFDIKANFDKIDDDYKNGFQIDIYKRKIIFLKRVFKIKLFIGLFIVIFLHSAISYFMIVFFTINSNTQPSFIVYLIFSIAGYFILYILILLIITLLRWISIKCSYPLFEFLFKLSIILAEF